MFYWLPFRRGYSLLCQMSELGSQTAFEYVPRNCFCGFVIPSLLWHWLANMIDSLWYSFQGMSCFPFQMGGKPVSFKIWSKIAKCLSRSSGESFLMRSGLSLEFLKAACSMHFSNSIVFFLCLLQICWPNAATPAKEIITISKKVLLFFFEDLLGFIYWFSSTYFFE